MKLHAERLVRLKEKSYVLFHARVNVNDDPDKWLNYPFMHDDFRVMFGEWADANIPQRGRHCNFRFEFSAIYFEKMDDAMMTFLAFC